MGKVTYWPQLDGIRAVAIIAVFASHTIWFVPGGFLGVDLFFVLSGFLITFLLMNEADLYGGINFRLFYIRRFLRLYPALVAMVILAGLFWRLLPSQGATYAQFSSASLFYYANLMPISFLNPLEPVINFVRLFSFG